MEETTTSTTTTACTGTTISVHAFEKLIRIINKDKSAGIRFRMRGELWYPNFLCVVQAGENNRTLFFDGKRNHNIILFDLSGVIQFELDAAIHPFAPGCHYQVSQEYPTDEQVQIDPQHTSRDPYGLPPQYPL